MTAEELENAQRELHELESTGRTQIAARIKTAREWGDLKNAEHQPLPRGRGSECTGCRYSDFEIA